MNARRINANALWPVMARGMRIYESRTKAMRDDEGIGERRPGENSANVDAGNAGAASEGRAAERTPDTRSSGSEQRNGEVRRRCNKRVVAAYRRWCGGINGKADTAQRRWRRNVNCGWKRNIAQTNVER